MFLKILIAWLLLAGVLAFGDSTLLTRCYECSSEDPSCGDEYIPQSEHVTVCSEANRTNDGGCSKVKAFVNLYGLKIVDGMYRNMIKNIQK